MTTNRRARPPAKRRPLAPETRRAAARLVIAANKANGKQPDPRLIAIAEGKTLTGKKVAPVAKRRRRTLEVRQAAARMVIAASKANGETPDPRIVAVAEGKAPSTNS